MTLKKHYLYLSFPKNKTNELGALYDKDISLWYLTGDIPPELIQYEIASYYNYKRN